MKIFISSVRKGLEEERDALPGIIRAIGHTPVLFEDFSAQTTPSRQACLAALDSADVCIFLLGPSYGHVFSETGQSATHDEWVVAKTAGKPRWVYRKLGVTFEDTQQKFARTVEAYATGVFRDSFHDTAELMTKVVGKIKELESDRSPLSFAPLPQPVPLRWSLDQVSVAGSANLPLLELHVFPVGFAGYSARALEEVGDSLADRIRRSGAVKNDVALMSSGSQEHVSVSIPLSKPRTWDSPRPGELIEVRLHKSGQVSLRATLPRDGLGSILDQDSLPQQVTSLLRFNGALDLIQHERIIVAIGVSDPNLTQVDRFNPHQSRTRAELSAYSRSFTLQTEPDESTSLAALDTGAEEVAGILSRALIKRHPSLSR
ncbi:DUF4062 domain-containing protein [Streptomyces sp. P01-B04]|uniref:DUF4062 domain-containing protein n=1 Tax=Streptomyces poriferorum TaxID=2798799 RepID=UPI001C5F9A67|nr:DUF4062 domain-containing protein [Streptomyces poriferorum]MBW5248413.1 DUF4062 domain-containing protein [Streptomyces poriferorum]MBW5256080.1 DUF4062 domain-containing protein [Streptomyces poriferorum]